MLRFLAPLFAMALFATAPSLAADEPKPAAPAGVWVKEADGVIIQFDFSKPKLLTVTATAGDRSLTLACKYTVDKAGVITAVTEKVDNKNEFPADLKKGYEFSFKMKFEAKTAHISDFAADNANARNIVEGEYQRKEAK